MGELDVTGRGSSNAWTAGAFIGTVPVAQGISRSSHTASPPSPRISGTVRPPACSPCGLPRRSI